MKHTLLLFATALLLGIQSYAQTGVAINTTGNEPETSAMLDVSSTTKGTLIPRMTQAQRNAISSPAEGLMIFQTDETTGFYYYQSSWKFVGTGLDYSLLTNKPGNATTATDGFMSAADKTKLDGYSAVHSIGESYGGGIIFWLDASGQHGLIAATADQTTAIQWYNGSYTTTGASLDGVYAGRTNTAKIISTQGTGSYAAQVCNDYAVTVNNEYYDDWYLPSKYELNLLFLQKDKAGGFSTNYYWSSNEDLFDAAWYQDFNNGNQDYIGKDYYANVRCIRKF